MTLFRSGIRLAFFTLIARIFGLARESFITSLFGVSNIADSVNVAFKLPNLFRRIFGEGALSTVFVPIFNEKMLKSRDAARNFTGIVFTVLLSTLVILIILMQIFMPSLMCIIAPGFYKNPEKFNLTVLLCRITIPYLVFISVTALFGGMLNSVQKFAPFAFSPIILSLSIIIGTVILQNHIEPAISVSLSLIVAGLLQVLFMFYSITKSGLLFPLRLKPIDKDVRKFFINMGPAAMSSGVQQLSLFISQSVVSYIDGAVSILSCADRIYQLPLSMIGVTFGTILLPKLSKIYKLNDCQQISKIQNNAIKIGLLLSLPASFVLIALSEPIIHLIYKRGAFTSVDTVKTAKVLSAFALGLPAFILIKILTPVFYANQDTKTPFTITIYSLTANIFLNLMLVRLFSYIGIAFASSIAAWYNVWLLYKYTKKYGQFYIDSRVQFYCCKVLFSCVIMTIVISIINHYYSGYFYSELLFVKIAALGTTLLIGAVFFGLMILYFKLHKMH